MPIAVSPSPQERQCPLRQCVRGGAWVAGCVLTTRFILAQCFGVAIASRLDYSPVSVRKPIVRYTLRF